MYVDRLAFSRSGTETHCFWWPNGTIWPCKNRGLIHFVKSKRRQCPELKVFDNCFKCAWENVLFTQTVARTLKARKNHQFSPSVSNKLIKWTFKMGHVSPLCKNMLTERSFTHNHHNFAQGQWACDITEMLNDMTSHAHYHNNIISGNLYIYKNIFFFRQFTNRLEILVALKNA